VFEVTVFAVTDHINIKYEVKLTLLNQDIMNTNYCFLSVETHII
jgi:hypothetical protein